ncbi:group 3 secretory phospholipase A2-like [Myripristis murdjan]|uniref:group 3 secretory phospholipase A2-like n=1 Tax=Myripristis murdjan TaxID=586833 RepID=UPI0011763503|nr:group 3 secretory phospholipase A2-like [Myripristis murdjan]
MGYEELGMFESADRCCREHDQCMHVIPAFTVNYGVFNSNFFTVSHCDCDRRFRECLFGVNDTISSMVGYSFFNILRIPCFELIRQRRCVKMYWWGMCKVAKKAPYAVFKNPFSYNTTRTTSKYREKPYGNESSNIKEHHVKERPPTVSVTKSPKSERRLTMAQRPSKTSLKSETTAKLWSTATTAFPIQGELKPGLLTQTAANHHQNGKSPRQRNTNALRDKMKQKPIITDNRLVCGILKHLDRCQHKILPLEKKYGLQNMESKTVYHCDCTSRLAGQIEHFKAPSILPSLLMDFVSRYCFKLPTETKCHNRKRF